MKRTMFFSAIFGSFALATVVSADSGQQNSKRSFRVGNEIRNFQGQGNNNFNRQQRLGKLGQLIDRFKHNDEKKGQKPPVPIDPGMGNGQPTAPPTPSVPTRPGYVWVGDHWERERAPQGNNVKPPIVVNPTPIAPVAPVGRPGFVWVGDHWERERAPQGNNVKPPIVVNPTPIAPVAPVGRPGFVWVGDHWERVKAEPKNTVTPTVVGQPTLVGPVIRDHRTSPPYVVSGNQGGIVIRDHRTPAAGGAAQAGQGGIVIRDHRTPKITIAESSQTPGGVTVTSTPRPPRRPTSNSSGDITGHGGLVDAIGGGLSAIGNALGNALGSAGNAVGIGYGTITPVGPAKPPYKVPPEATIRDHRK